MKQNQHKKHDEIVIKITIREHEDEQENEGCEPGGEGEPGPIATPFLMIPYGAGDGGQRPIPVSQAITNQGIQSPIVTGISGGWTDVAFQLWCTVANPGTVGSTGLAEFYVGDQFSIWYPGHEGLTPAQVQANAQLVGRASFVVPPGATITVVCPDLWKPGSFEAAQKGILVQITDLFTDPLTVPFDAVNDRHVARNDEIMDPILE